MLCYAMLCYAMLCYAMLCYAMLCYAVLCCWQVTKLEAHKAGLVSHMHNVEDCCAQLMEQLKALKQKWCATCVENVKLYKKIFELRKALDPGEDLVLETGKKRNDYTFWRQFDEKPSVILGFTCVWSFMQT